MQPFLAIVKDIVARGRNRAGTIPLVPAAAAALGLALWAAGSVSFASLLIALAAFYGWFFFNAASDQSNRGTRTDDRGGAGIEAWRAVVDALPAPVLVLDGSGIVLHANPHVPELLGLARRGAHISQVSRQPELLAAVDAAVRQKERQSVDLHERVPVERRFRATVAPIEGRRAGSADAALLVFLEDFTEQDQVARMRVDFVANASHELRTPLAALKGFIETLRGPAKNDADARARFLEIMQEQADRMTRLIEDLLSLSRIEMRERIAPRGAANLRAILELVVQSLAPLATSAGTTVQVSPPDGPDTVYGEHDELVQVFQNLVQNAIKYGKPGGRVSVVLQHVAGSGGAPERVAVAVADDGPGIAPHYLPRLTERFYRVSTAESRQKGGTGLGLAIVKHIVNRHRGELRIELVPGAGSTFTVLLPAVAESLAEAPAKVL